MLREMSRAHDGVSGFDEAFPHPAFGFAAFSVATIEAEVTRRAAVGVPATDAGFTHHDFVVAHGFFARQADGVEGGAGAHVGS